MDDFQNEELKPVTITLPYPVGIRLFLPYKVQGVVQDRLRRYQINKDGILFCTHGQTYPLDAIGVSVFLSEEEAKAELERRYGKTKED